MLRRRTSSSTTTRTSCARRRRGVALSPTEYKLLRFLLRNPGRALSRNQILDHVWDYDFDGESTVVETFVSFAAQEGGSPGPAHPHRAGRGLPARHSMTLRARLVAVGFLSSCCSRSPCSARLRARRAVDQVDTQLVSAGALSAFQRTRGRPIRPPFGNPPGRRVTRFSELYVRADHG